VNKATLEAHKRRLLAEQKALEEACLRLQGALLFVNRLLGEETNEAVPSAVEIQE
jgi:hypothetical protein